MQKTLLFLFLFCGFLSTQAQVFRPGLLVLATGDTLRGELEDDSWDDAPLLVRFRPASTAEAITYSTVQILAFRLVDGRYYRRETVPLDRSAHTELDRLVEKNADNATPNSVPETLLAEVVVDGPGQLLYTGVEGVPHYFVRRAGQPFIELAARRYLRRNADSHLQVADGNNFRAQLEAYLGDCPAAMQNIGRLEFTRARLAAVVQAYNLHCNASHQLAPYYQSRFDHRTGLYLGAVGGGRYVSSAVHTADVNGLQNPGLEGVNLDGQLHALGGLELDVLPPGRRVALHLAGLITTFGRQGSVPPLGTGQAGQLDTRETVTEYRLGLRYFWLVGNRKLRVLAGTGVTFPVLWDKSKPVPRVTYAPGATLPGVATNDELPSSYPTSGDGFLPGLPYVEVGARQGRLTLLLDGRLGSAREFYTVTSVRTTSNGYPEGYSYAYRNWYVGAMLSVALVHKE